MKTNYASEIEFLKKVEINSNRTIFTADQTKNLLLEFPNLPQDYIIYLQEIGSGSFRESQFNVTAPFNLEDLGLEYQYELKSNVWFFGDNFSGDFSGFDLDQNDGKVVEFWHDSGELYYTNQSFHNYIREQMMLYENGNKIE